MENLILDHDGYNLFDTPNETGSPERRLILAVIERAILDYVGNEQKEAQDAKLWIFSDEFGDENDQFSFDWACFQLDLDAATIRRKIHNMPKRGTSRLAPWYMKQEQSA
jgi:hypothetical protein